MSNKTQTSYTEKIKTDIINMGADLVGIADLDLCRDLPTIPLNLCDSFNCAISIAVKLPTAVFDMIEDEPTPIYANVYQTANRILDKIAFRTVMALEKDGFYALAIPASQILDLKNFYAAVSHKAVARMAGIGWQGKNLLIITPEYGSRVRLVTILTKAPLEPDAPIKNRCGKCTLCQEACPVGAIKGINTESHYTSRNEALHFDKCAENLTQNFAKLPGIDAPICGICIKVCPFGNKF
jgi:epoxyqueuosine reductase